MLLKMKLVFVTNYINHHQVHLADDDHKGS